MERSRIFNAILDSSALEDFKSAVEWLRSGRILAFPTETFYGLGVDPTSDVAVRALFDLKGRDARVAVPLIASSVERVRAFPGGMNAASARVAADFWPGPISLVFDAPPDVSADVHGGLGTVAVRVPANALARRLAEAIGGLLTATSANRSGEAPATTAADLHALARDPRVRVIDGGTTPGGAPSTIVDARGSRPVLIRDGAIPWNRVLESIDR